MTAVVTTNLPRLPRDSVLQGPGEGGQGLRLTGVCKFELYTGKWGGGWHDTFLLGLPMSQ